MKGNLLLIWGAGLTTILSAHPHEDLVSDPGPVTQVIKTGAGANTYEAVPNWGLLEGGKRVGPTNGSVAVDKAGLVYIGTDAEDGILVFKPGGTLVRKIGVSQVHGMIIHEEDGKEYLYCAHRPANRMVKMDLEGKEVLVLPNEKSGKLPGGLKGMTSVVVAPDKTLFLVMGYGSDKIHHLAHDGRLLKTFNQRGKGDGKTNTAHALLIDSRFDPPRLLVADRENNRLVHYGLDGNWIGVHSTEVGRPTDLSLHGDLCAVAELTGRVSIVDKDGKTVAKLGENPKPKQRANYKVKPSKVEDGIFTAAHGISYDAAGNLYVQDWNRAGRITKLSKVSKN